MDDFLSTTAVVVWVRNKITPTMLWSTIGVLVAALLGSTIYIRTMQLDMRNVEEAVAESKKSMADMQKRFEVINEINTQLAGIKADLRNYATEVEHQRQRWERIDEVAESPPHARRRR